MSYWWCPSCKRELDGCNVTYEENCDICGSRVLSIDESISQEEVVIAIEKQIAKKPIQSYYNEGNYEWICPTCDSTINEEGKAYCHWCGQKIR